MAGESIDAYIADYCNNIADGTQEKLTIIAQIDSIEITSQNFTDDCIDYVDDYANWWFDPIIPSETITYGDTCDAFKELFMQLELMAISSYEDKVIYSYVMIYQLYINSMEETVFSKCIDSELAFDPVSYCTKNIVDESNFTIWSNDTSTQYCT